MKRLYQWFSEQASFFFSDLDGDTSRTVRTEVTVQREALTLLVSEAATACDICPLCGQKLAPAKVGQTSFHLLKASTLGKDAGNQ
jgi:hypothetical protein